MKRHPEGRAVAIIWDCPYCDSKYREREQLKLHLIDKHRLEMQKLVDRCRSSQTIRWAAGWRAAFCGHDEQEGLRP